MFFKYCTAACRIASLGHMLLLIAIAPVSAQSVIRINSPVPAAPEMLPVPAEVFQTPAPAPTSGNSVVPLIPERSPRVLEAPGETILQSSPDRAVGSFIDSLQGSDAAIEVVAGQGKLLTLKEKLAVEGGEAVIAVGDPSIVDFEIMPNSRLIRVLGLRPGTTDLAITTADDQTYTFEVRVTYDLTLLRARLRQLFPDADLRIAQLRDHVVVEGQARNPAQVARILETLEAYLASMQAETDLQSATIGDPTFTAPAAAREAAGEGAVVVPDPTIAAQGGLRSAEARAPGARVINLLRVPGAQQVLLQVRIAELNRTAMREVGADWLIVDPDNGNIVGTRIGGAVISASGLAGLGGLLGTSSGELGTSSTAFGIFPSGDFQAIMRLLRENGFLRVLAEPNLITMSGHRANFLAGGEFPVPVPQAGGVAANAVTVQFREFGVRLDFLPYVIDEDRIRLTVTPEVSTIDFSLGTTLVVGGDPVPGLNTRRANTTVELRPGQTLAMAGLLQVELDGRTSRIPGLGDLPYLGPFFSNTTHRRVEKELVVLVTPHFAGALDAGHGIQLPGENVEDPTDWELYFKNRYEGRTGLHHRSTIEYGFDQPRRLMYHEKKCIQGPVGFSD
jgi:pilus assembly protein CpaC